VPLSQGLKAGLAAGVVYGGLVGLLHVGTLEACSAAQINYISQQIVQLNSPTNETASQMFSTDVLYFPMIYGIWGLIYGVLYGALFGSIYSRLPGSSSKIKGMSLAVPVFLIGVFAGPMDYFLYHCSPSFIPYISLGLGLPVSFLFGYFLGLFYDSFGRLALEEKQNAKAGTDPGMIKASGDTGKNVLFHTKVSRLLRARRETAVKWKSLHLKHASFSR